MKKLFLWMLLSAFFFGCSPKQDRPTETTPVDNTQTETPPPPPAQKDSSGTSIHVDQEGVSVGHKDDKNKSDVKISRDSFKIDVNTRKK